MPKHIVTRGESFFYSSPSDIKLCKTYGEGEIVDLSLVDGKPPKIGSNLRALTAAELKMTPAALRKKELGEDEKAIEDETAEAA